MKHITGQNCIYKKVAFIILLIFFVLLLFKNVLADDQVIQKWADINVESDIRDENDIVIIPSGNYELSINATSIIDVSLPIYNDRPDYEVNSIICKNITGDIIEKSLPLVIATQNAKQIVRNKGLSPNFYQIIPVPEPAWIAEINGWSGLHYFVPTQATVLYRNLFLSPAFEDQIPDANGHVTRFYHYKEAFYEAVLQRELNKELYSSDNYSFQAMNEAEKILKLISSLGSLIPVNVRTDAISYFQRIVELGSQGIPDTLSIPDTLDESLQSLAEIIKNHVGDIDLSKKVSLLGTYLNALPVVTSIANDIAEYFVIQSFLIEAEVQARINALDEIAFEDEVARNAYQEVKAEINTYSLNYYLENSGLEAEDLLNYLDLFIPKLISVPGVPAGLALWVGIDLALDIISDANSFLFLTAIATIQQEMATHLRPRVDTIDGANIGYEETNKLVRLLSIENTLDYTYYSVLKRIYEFNWTSPNSWIQNATYFIFSFLGYNTYFEFIAELENILYYKLYEPSRVERFILFPPYYLADLGTCNSLSIECPNNVSWLTDKVVAENVPFFSDPIIFPTNPNTNNDVTFSITYNDYDEDFVDSDSVKVVVEGIGFSLK